MRAFGFSLLFVMVLGGPVLALDPATSPFAQHMQTLDVSAYARSIPLRPATPFDPGTQQGVNDVEAGLQSYEAAIQTGHPQHFSNTIAYLQRATAHKGHPDLFNMIGSSYMALGQYRQASAAFDQAVQLDKRNGMAWQGLGMSKSYQARYADAISDYQKAAKLIEPDCSFLSHQAYALHMTGKFGRAERAYIKALEAPQPCVRAAIGMAFIQMDLLTINYPPEPERFQHAVQFMQIAEKLDPGNPWVAEFNSSVLGAAVDGMARPSHPQAAEHLDKAEYYFARKDHKSALHHYQQAERFAPQNDMVQLFMGDAYFGMERFDEALARYRRALQLNPRNFRAWRFIGDTLERKGDLNGAYDAYRNALAINPDYALARMNFASVSRRLGR